MIRLLIKIAVVVIIAILVYNYFFGTSAEKASSKKVFVEVKELALSIKDLVKSEKEKFEAGKYDKALEKINSAIKSIKAQIPKGQKQYDDDVKELEYRRNVVSQELKALKADKNVEPGDPRIKILKRDLQELSDQLEEVTEDLNQKK